jgi:hypothetical protein
MTVRDILSNSTEEWRPWHLPRLSGDPWRGPNLPQCHPVFRPSEPALRPLRIGVSYEVYRLLRREPRGALLGRLLCQEPIRTFIIPVGATPPPPGFKWCRYGTGPMEAVENWSEYATTEARGRARLIVRASACGESTETPLDVDDIPFRRSAGLPVDEPFVLPTSEDDPAAPAFQVLVAKALRCDLFITVRPALTDLDAGGGYKHPTEPISPDAAVPLIGLYLRGLGYYRLGDGTLLGRRWRAEPPYRDATQAITFFHQAAQAMLWATFEWELLSDRLADPSDRAEFTAFGGTMLHRLEQALRERDRLLRMLAVAPFDAAPAFFAGDAFDMILLLSQAALDASAEAVNLLFGLGARNPAWTRSFVGTLPAKCQPLADLFSEKTSRPHYHIWQALSELRNSIHSVAISGTPTIYVAHDFAGRVLLPIPDRRFAIVREHLEKLGGLTRWGVFEDAIHQNRPALHPGEFVEQLVPRVFDLIHRVMIATLVAAGVVTYPMSGGRFGRPLSDTEADTLRLLGLARVPY